MIKTLLTYSFANSSTDLPLDNPFETTTDAKAETASSTDPGSVLQNSSFKMKYMSWSTSDT